jgi:hypothetical protein
MTPARKSGKQAARGQGQEARTRAVDAQTRVPVDRTIALNALLIADWKRATSWRIGGTNSAGSEVSRSAETRWPEDR